VFGPSPHFLALLFLALFASFHSNPITFFFFLPFFHLAILHTYSLSHFLFFFLYRRVCALIFSLYPCYGGFLPSSFHICNFCSTARVFGAYEFVATNFSVTSTTISNTIWKLNKTHMKKYAWNSFCYIGRYGGHRYE
jgi:hypothetical protein